MGFVIFALKYGFPNEVKSKGAVSPEMRAILKITPDKIPLIAAGNKARMVV